jgi:hypothetical protein
MLSKVLIYNVYYSFEPGIGFYAHLYFPNLVDMGNLKFINRASKWGMLCTPKTCFLSFFSRYLLENEIPHSVNLTGNN